MYLCPKFVIMCKYENCVCKYLTFLFRCEILFENNLIFLLYDNVQQYNYFLHPQRKWVADER